MYGYCMHVCVVVFCGLAVAFVLAVLKAVCDVDMLASASFLTRHIGGMCTVDMLPRLFRVIRTMSRTT